MWCPFREQKSYLPYRMNRLEKEMGNFENALADLSAKVEAVLAVISRDAAALEAARAAVADAQARADRVIAEDAAEDAATDATRAESLAAVSARLDEVLGEPAQPEPVVEEQVVDPALGEPAAE